MSDATTAVTAFRDAFGRVAELVEGLADGLADPDSTFRVDTQANTPAWLLWHLTRVQDHHIADLAGEEQVWTTWRSSFDLPFDAHATGFGQDADQVAQVRADGTLLAGYHADVHELTNRYLDTLTSDELSRIVDERWDPPVTASARLVSVLGDTFQHAGQAAFVLGVAHRTLDG
jgi:uncharacterized protein DUF664